MSKEMLQITSLVIRKELHLLKKPMGRFSGRNSVEEYCFIQDMFKLDGPKSLRFQKEFCKFYGINAARRSKEWKKSFFDYMNKQRLSFLRNGKDPKFVNVLKGLKGFSGKLEASFASKLVATIDPTSPILDKWVLVNFNILRDYQKAKSVAEKDAIFQTICRKYSELSRSSRGKEIISMFDKKFPSLKISRNKKLDFVLWRMRL